MPLLHKGVVIEGRYAVQRKLGEGQFAEVWEVKLVEPGTSGLDLRYALKLEKRKDRSTVKQEYKVLKRLSGLCSQVVAVEGSGTHEERFYMVMQLLGETLYDARKHHGGCLDLATIKAVGLSTLGAIEQVHSQGYIHRDIKPANFVISPPNAAASKGTWALIDFGLVRRYRDEGGVHLAPRADASFRGSTTYASLAAHREEDLSRRDDLWSWTYMMVELLDGCLPWRADRDVGEAHAPVDKHWVQQQKEACMEDPAQLTRNIPMPEPLLSICSHLKGLAFEDAPDYSLIRGCLQQLPDSQQVQLQLHSLLPQQLQQQYAANGQQHDWGASPLYGQQQDLQQQQWQQQWQDVQAANGGQQQQQHDVLLTPASPPQQMLPPPEAPAALTAGNKRSRSGALGAAAGGIGGSSDHDQQAKRLKPDSSIPRKPSSTGQLLQQQGHQRQGSSSSSAMLSPPDVDDGRPDSRQGSLGAQRPKSQEPAAAAAPGQPLTQHNGTLLQQQQQPHIMQAGAEQQAQINTEQDWQAAPLQAEPQQGVVYVAAATGTGSGGATASLDGQTAAVAAAAAGAGASAGRADEITDLLAAFSKEAPDSSKAATQQAVAGLCALGPLEAVCAISMTLNKLVHQSDPACLPAVSQLLLDLAAFATQGAAAAAAVLPHSGS